MVRVKNIKLIRTLQWEEVFLFWYQSEGTNKNWVDLAKKRGFKSWAQWRLTSYALPFACARARWGLYEITNPALVISKFYGGPFQTWIEHHYNGDKEKTFAELAGQPDISDNENVKGIIRNFPDDKIITCLKVGRKTFTIEGSHRCCALVVMHRENKPTPEKILVAIGKSPLEELPIVGSHENKK